MLCIQKTCSAFALTATMLLPQIASSQQRKVCSATDADKPEITKTIEGIFDAGMTNNLAAFDSLIAPNFYMYDGGKRYDGDALMRTLIDMKQHGYKYIWSVQDPSIEIDCNTAWVAYVNKGSTTTPDGIKKDRTWLESAVLVKQNGLWLVRFFHSTPAPE
jgi:Domain of unknown function (DUF4440)